MIVFDSHCHLTADAFDDDRVGVIERARRAGVQGLCCIASTPSDAEQAIALARRHPGMVATAGIHPHEAGNATADDLARVDELLREPEVRAVGECGLDFHYDFVPRDQQFTVFRAQAELAVRHDLPLVVHCRSADDEMIEEFAGAVGEALGVLHCFSAGDALLDTALKAGWFISFSGLVTFRNFARADQVERVPLDRLLVETDSPYLAPVPHRGHRNEPAHVVETLRRVAELRGGDAEELGHAVTRNARRFYGLDDSGGAGREADARGLRMASDPSPADVRGGESA